MSKEGIKIFAQNALEKYEGEINVPEIINQIKENLNNALNSYLEQNNVLQDNFPIEFENELGKWKINADGNIYVQPKKGIQHIEYNITINKND